MERIIEVVVDVNSDDHAELIRKDILRVVQSRTTLWFVGDPVNPKLPYSLVETRGVRKGDDKEASDEG